MIKPHRDQRVYAASLEYLEISLRRLRMEFDAGLQAYLILQHGEIFTVTTSSGGSLVEIIDGLRIPAGVEPNAFRAAVIKSCFWYQFVWCYRATDAHPEA